MGIFNKIKSNKEQEKPAPEPRKFEKNTALSYSRYLEHLYPAKNDEESFLDSLVDTISLFEPLKKYHYENQYEVDLARYLHNKFPQAHIEELRGNSRPDIVLNDVAIEIKGPTTFQGLESIPGKILRYQEDYPDGMIVVLFDLQVDFDYFKKWKERLTSKFPEVRVLHLGL